MDPADAAPQSADIAIIPNESLKFNLDVKPKTAVVQLKLQHPGPLDAAVMAYKIKTTAPKRYLVRPNQGMIPPGKSVQVDIILVDRDHIVLRDDPAQREAGEAGDKFLVQTTPAVSDGNPVMDPESLTPEESQQMVLAIWAGADKRAVAGRRLKVRFQRGDGGAAAAPAAAAAAAGAPPAAAAAAGGGGGGAGAADWATVKQGVKAQVAEGGAAAAAAGGATLADVQGLRKKYDDLVAFTVNLTAERDMLNNELGEMKRDLQRERVMRIDLEQKAGEGLRKRKPGTSDEKASADTNASDTGKPAKGGFSLFQIMVAALLFFFLGKYLGSE